MDDKKDTTQNIKDIENNPKNKALDFVKKDKNFLYFLKKTERIVAALHLVSGFFPEHEVIRSLLRNTSLCLLQEQISLFGSAEYASEKVLDSVRSLFARTLSLFEVAYYSGYVSTMNFSVLRGEIIDVALAFEREMGSKSSRGLILEGGFFDVSDFLKDKVSSQMFADDKKNNLVRSSSTVPEAKTFSKGHDKGQSPVKDIKDKAEKNSEKHDRQKNILQIFERNRGKQLSINDVSIAIKNCSSKTIQRELLDLVAKGQIKKDGERRWSRYILI